MTINLWLNHYKFKQLFLILMEIHTINRLVFFCNQILYQQSIDNKLDSKLL